MHGSGKTKGKGHYVDNDQFRTDMQTYTEHPSPPLLEFISQTYLVPINEAVANNWKYMFSDHHDLTQTGLLACIRAINHPNALSHPFNFFTRVSRNAMLDLSRSDSGKAQKQKDHVDGYNSQFIRPQISATTDHQTDCPIIQSILHGDGTTKQGQASIPKIAKETGLSKEQITERLKQIGQSVISYARPSLKNSLGGPETAKRVRIRRTPLKPRKQPEKPVITVFTYQQLSLPLGPFPDEPHKIQKLRRANRPQKQNPDNHVPRSDVRNSRPKPYTGRLFQGPVTGLWN